MATSKKSSKRTNTRRKTSSKNKKTISKELSAEQEALRDEVVFWSVVAISALLFLGNFNLCGDIGGASSSLLFGLFGLIAYIFPILLCLGCAFAISNKGNGFAIVKIVAYVIFACFICCLLALITHGENILTPVDSYKESSTMKYGGGFIGGTLAYLFVPAFGLIGSYVISVIVILVSLVLITEKSAINGMKRGGRHVYESAKENNERYQEYREQKLEEKAKRRMDLKVSGVSVDTKLLNPNELEKASESDSTRPILNLENKPIDKTIDSSMELEPVSNRKHTKLVSGDKLQPIFPPEPELAASNDQFEIKGDFLKESEAVPAAENAKPTKQEVAKAQDEVTKEISQNETVKNYAFPPISLLNQPTGKRNGNTENDLRATAKKLEVTLANFGVNAKVTNVSCGPAVTRYEIQPEMGVKVSKIVNLADDIKLNLAVADIRIEAPIPGKPAVGIEVPNKENVTVSFRELIESNEFKSAKSKVSFAVGKDISGAIKVTDIAKMPHLLIAGATGSGKSVCINTIIMSILYKANPNDVKMIMIDPKVVELSVYNGIPHLLIPVVTDPKKAAGALQWAVSEMTDRYEKFAAYGVRDIHGFNHKVDTLGVSDIPGTAQKMPQIIVIVDELADLMMVASNDVEEAICRLAQLARAAGIHLVIATQRPSVNVITGLIKANMPSRIAFAVTSGVDSRTILDMNGAEKLLGKGDMLFNPQGIPKPIRVQGAFVTDEEVAKVVDFLKENNQTSYSEDIQSKVETLQSSGNKTVSISDADNTDDGRDAYFVEAAKILLDKDKASIGMLQRYLKVGFNRAARIMDQLEEAGVVGPEEGTKPRKILMSPEQFEQYVDEYL